MTKGTSYQAGHFSVKIPGQFGAEINRAEHWALIGSIIETARMCGVEPFAYLKDALTKITNGHPINRIAELTPWAYMAKATDNPGHDIASTNNLSPTIIPAT